MASSDISKTQPTLTRPLSEGNRRSIFSSQRRRGIFALITLISGIGVGYFLLISAISYFVDTL